MSSIVRHAGRNLVAYMALLFALTGTSIAAANYVNGSQIRPHSIPKNRLTPSAIASLRAVTGVTSVSSVYGRPVQECAANGGACSTGVAYARCPKFSYVVGGGYRSTMPDNVVMWAATTAPTTYSVVAVNEGHMAGTIRAQAICLSGPGLVPTFP